MTDAQVWTALAIMAAAFASLVTLTLTSIKAQLAGMRGEVSAEINGLRAEMNARFDTVNHKIDSLDRDVQAITNRWGRGEV
jgi:hypothetical protein